MFRNKNNLEPKKEYIRCQSIRAFKRSIRDSLKENYIPRAKLHSVDKANYASLNEWREYSGYVVEYRYLYEDLAQTETGPNTDGKAKRDYENCHKSFNDAFCVQFFGESHVKQLFSRFIRLVFSRMSCKILTKKFEISPCGCKKNFNSSIHSNEKECISKWKIMKDYLQTTMLEDLGLNVEEEGPTGNP